MFDLSALVMLTLFNLIALIQIASNILVPARLQRGPVLGAAAVCLATSLTGLAMAILVPSPIVGIASITIAALVNLFAVLGTGLERLGDPSSAEARRSLRGLARLAIVGAPTNPSCRASCAALRRAPPLPPDRPPSPAASAPARSLPRQAMLTTRCLVCLPPPDNLPARRSRPTGQPATCRASLSAQSR